MIIMKQYDNSITNVNNNNHYRKKTVLKPKVYRKFNSYSTLPILVVLISAALGSTYPVHATGGASETGATAAPGGASLGSAGSGTNVTQSDCLSQNATTRGSLVVDAGDATSTAANDTTTTFAPQGAGIGANDTSASNATAGNTITTNNTTTTVAPQGASVC